MRYVVRFVALAIAALVSGCQPSTAVSSSTPATIAPTRVAATHTAQPAAEQAAANPIDDGPCAPPCWANIVPGKSTHDDAKQLLSLQRSIASDCKDTRQESRRGIECKWVSVVFVEDKDIVESIALVPDRAVTLDELVSKFGPPDKVDIDASGRTPERYYVIFSLYFASRGFYAVADVNNWQDYRLTPAKLAVGFLYAEPSQIRLFEDTSERDTFQDTWVVTWHGFGDYSQYVK